MAEATPATKQKCTYKHHGWPCPFDAEEGPDRLCIFHLPIDKKNPENFWCKLADYRWSLLVAWDMRRGFGIPSALDRRLLPSHWLRKATDDWRTYENTARSMSSWHFTGFVFPAMDDVHNFRYLDFPKVDFSDARFTGQADFSWVGFQAEANFEDTWFLGNSSFRDVTAEDKLLFFRARIFKDFNLSYAHVKHRLHFGGAQIGPDATLRLWGLNFTLGSMGPALGEVVFRDLPEQAGGGMSRVSFMHTVVYEDRPCFRFENVHWQEKPDTFLLDAGLALNGGKDRRLMGVTADRKRDMCQLFNIITEPGTGETPEQVQTRVETSLYNLVQQDVERAAREIRRYYEDFASYPDAGHYHIAEMEYRQRRTRGSKWLVKALLWLYGRVSRYGESPGRAAGCLLGVILASTLLYPFCGFNFGTIRDETGVARDNLVHLLPIGEPSRLGPTILAFAKSFLFSLANLAPGYFRFQSLSAASGWTTAISMIQAIFGVVLLTLLVLAIRRRFRR